MINCCCYCCCHHCLENPCELFASLHDKFGKEGDFKICLEKSYSLVLLTFLILKITETYVKNFFIPESAEKYKGLPSLFVIPV